MGGTAVGWAGAGGLGAAGGAPLVFAVGLLADFGLLPSILNTNLRIIAKMIRPAIPATTKPSSLVLSELRLEEIKAVADSTMSPKTVPSLGIAFSDKSGDASGVATGFGGGDNKPALVAVCPL